MKLETIYLGSQIIPQFFQIPNKKDTETPITLHERDQGYAWDDDCEEQFKAFLSNHKIKLENANQTTKQNSDANELANEIKKSILDASKECNLKKKKHRKNAKSNPWFDKECLDLKKTLTEIGRGYILTAFKEPSPN